jgi:hypothetical protein
MRDSELPMFSVQGLTDNLKELIVRLNSENNENERFQVAMNVETIVGQIRRLQRPITRSDKGGTNDTFTAADEMGLSVILLGKVRRLVEHAQYEFLHGHQSEAVAIGNQALSAWIDVNPSS